MNAKISPDQVTAGAKGMRSIAGEMKLVELQISALEIGLRFLRGASFDKFRRELSKQNQYLIDSRKKVASLEEALEAIAAKYSETEQRVSELKSIGMVWHNIQSNSLKRKVPNEEKDSVIREFEKNHSKEVEKLNKFLDTGKVNNLTEDDIRNIKYLIYTAEEPYRSIYLKSVSKYKIDTMDADDQAFYRPWKHTVTYDYPDSFDEDPRGPYTTFFHEGGHAIDDLSEKAKWLGSDTEKFKAYSADMGKKVTLREAIEYDVYYNKNNEHSISSIADQIISNGRSGSRGNIDHVIDAFKNGNLKSLSKEDLSLYNAVCNEFKRVTEARGTHEAFEAVSDVYGGVTRNGLRNGYGHDTAYWNNENNTGSELWAEFFSYHMTGNEENLNNLIEFFPEASKVLDQYANTLGG